jgi:hypothetical protein
VSASPPSEIHVARVPARVASNAASAGPKDADYIHVEIYANYDKHQINRAAAAWLLRKGNLTEPWLYLIAPNGMIADRWGPLFDPSQVMTELRRVAG